MEKPYTFVVKYFQKKTFDLKKEKVKAFTKEEAFDKFKTSNPNTVVIGVTRKNPREGVEKILKDFRGFTITDHEMKKILDRVDKDKEGIIMNPRTKEAGVGDKIVVTKGRFKGMRGEITYFFGGGYVEVKLPERAKLGLNTKFTIESSKLALQNPRKKYRELRKPARPANYKKIMKEIDETPNEWRFRLMPPGRYDSDSFRYDDVTKGVRVIAACPKGEFSMGRCRNGVEYQALRLSKDDFKTKESAAKWIAAHTMER